MDHNGLDTAEQMTCQELVELVTDHLEGALEPGDAQRFEEHLRTCGHCVDYVEQIEIVVGALRGLDDQPLPDELRERLIAAFREWKQAGLPG